MPSDLCAFVVAEMSDQGLAGMRVTVTPGEPERRITVCGEEGTLILSNEFVTLQHPEDESRTVTLSNELRAVRQRFDEAAPVGLEIAESDRQPAGIQSGMHTWNRLIADFVTAVRRGDVAHESVPHLPHVADGLAAQEVIGACERSHAEQRWVTLGQGLASG
jgi:predicted dehydrogenase